MKEILRTLLSPSLRFSLREKKHRLKELLRLACIWRWQFIKLPSSIRSEFAFYYLGRKSQSEMAMGILGIDGSDAIATKVKQKVLVSEFPIPGAICLPHFLTMIIPLKNRTLDEILMDYEKRKSKFLRNQRSDFVLITVTEVEEILRLDQEMLRPYALARYGEHVYQLPISEVMDMAMETGRFHLLLHEGKEVGCQIGRESVRNRVRYWESVRAGFSDFIFTDNKRYCETNLIKTFLGLEWALENGFEYYDIGTSFAGPENGLIQYKRSLGSELDTTGNYSYFYLMPPKTDVAKFYWDTPLFALEDKTIVLHLGLPDGVSDLEVSNRYKLMGFRGLTKVYLHYDSQYSDELIAAVRGIYGHLTTPPVVECVGHSINLKSR